MAGKALDGTSLTPEARVANNIVRISNEDGTAGTGFKMPMTDISLRDIQRTLNQAQALLASSGSAITAGQGYIIDNGGVLQLPTGISLMRVRGINLPAGVKGFSPNAEAYITALATWVRCTYDVGTNTAVVVIEQEFLIVDIDGNPTLTVLKNDTPSITFTVELISNNTPYRIISSVEIWNATKTKVKGFSFLNATSEPNISSGYFESTTKIQVNAFNPISLSNEPKAVSSELTFKVITIL